MFNSLPSFSLFFHKTDNTESENAIVVVLQEDEALPHFNLHVRHALNTRFPT